MLILTAKVETSYTYTLNFQHFGPFTYVTRIASGRSLKFVEDKRVGRSISKPKEYGYCIARKSYEEHKDKPFWFVTPSSEDQFEAVSSKFFKAYQAGIGWKIEFSDRHIDLLQALKDEKFERIIKNRYSNNHTLLDHKDRIVYHCIRTDYCHGQLRDGTYHLDKLAKHLKKRKDTKNVDVIDIPYYNAESNGERAIEFTYIPPKSRWNQFIEWYYPDTISSKYKLFDKLGISKFRKED